MYYWKLFIIENILKCFTQISPLCQRAIYIYIYDGDVNIHDTSIKEMFLSQYRELRAIGIMKGCWWYLAIEKQYLHLQNKTTLSLIQIAFLCYVSASFY